MSFQEAPTPTYGYETQALRQMFESALEDIEREMNNLFLTDFERAQLLATEASIRDILASLDADVALWSQAAMTTAVTDGAAAALFSLGLAKTIEEARAIVQLNTLNRELVLTLIADTQTDLLAVTQNVSRRTRSVIRRGTARVLRQNAAVGINSTRTNTSDLVKAWKKDLNGALNSGIIDAAGRRWRPTTYAETLVRTKMMQAHTEATTNEALTRGALYGMISTHQAVDACRYHEGRIVKLDASAPGDYPTVEELRESRQIFHPNCRHIVSAFRRIEDLSAARRTRAEEKQELGRRAQAAGGRNPQI